jgi:hypothetical protein
MTVSIRISVPDASRIFDVDAFSTAMSQAVHKIAWEASDFWKTIAGQRLKTSREEYQKAITVFGSSGNNSVSVGLQGGFLPQALELGTPGYPMHVAPGQIVPLNVNRAIIFTSPKVWREGTGEPWMHPGFPGFNMMADVAEYVTEELSEKYIDEAIQKLLGG